MYVLRLTRCSGMYRGELAYLAADGHFSKLHFTNVAAELADELQSDKEALRGLLQSGALVDFFAEDEKVIYKNHAKACSAACHPEAAKADSNSCQCEDGRFPLRRPFPL